MKLSRINIILPSFFLLALAACDSNDLPHVFSGNEVPDDVANEPRVVEKPAPGMAESQPWMRLGDVPSKPSDFTSPVLIQQTRQQMLNERTQAEQLKQAADNPPPQQMPNTAY